MKLLKNLKLICIGFAVCCIGFVGYSVYATTYGGAGNEMSVTIPVYIESSAGDVLQMQINSKDGTNQILDDGLFYINYLHD